MNQFIWIFNFKCGIASSDAFCFHIFFPFKYVSVFVWLFHVRPQIRSKPSPCKCILQAQTRMFLMIKAVVRSSKAKRLMCMASSCNGITWVKAQTTSLDITSK